MHIQSHLYVYSKRRVPGPTKNRAVSFIQMPVLSDLQRKTAVTATLFLNKRPMDPQYGTLVVATGEGNILMFSHHIHSKGYMESFLAIHMAGDTVMAMESDADNRLLFVGTTQGYIKTWLIINYWWVDISTTSPGSILCNSHFAIFVVKCPPRGHCAHQYASTASRVSVPHEGTMVGSSQANCAQCQESAARQLVQGPPVIGQ